MSGLDDLYGAYVGGGNSSSPDGSSLDDLYNSTFAEEERKRKARELLAQRQAEMRAMGALPTGSIESQTGALPRTAAPSTADEIRSIADPALFAATHAIPFAANVAKGVGLDALTGLAETAVKASRGPLGVGYPGAGPNAEGAPVTRALREKLDSITGPYLAEDPGFIRSGLSAAGQAEGMLLPVGEAVGGGAKGVDAAATVGERLAAKLPRNAIEGALYGIGASADETDPLQRAKEIGTMAALSTGLGALGALHEHVSPEAIAARKKIVDAGLSASNATGVAVPAEESPFSNARILTPEGTPVEAAKPDSLEAIYADSLGGRAGRSEPAPESASPRADGSQVRPGDGEALRRPSPAVRTGVGQEVPLPAGPVYRGQATSADVAPLDSSAIPAHSHLAGTHYSESPGYAALHAEKYGDQGQVVQLDSLPIEKPFSTARDYSYDDLRQIHPDAALRAARDTGITEPDQPIPGQAMQKALVDHFLGDQPRTEESVSDAIDKAGEAIRAAGYDAYHHEVFSPPDGGKVNAWSVLDKERVPTNANHVIEPVGRPEPSPVLAGAVGDGGPLRGGPYQDAAGAAPPGLPRVGEGAGLADAGLVAPDSGAANPRSVAAPLLQPRGAGEQAAAHAAVTQQLLAHAPSDDVRDIAAAAQAAEKVAPPPPAEVLSQPAAAIPPPPVSTALPDTGIKNAVTASERAARGLPDIEVAARRNFGDVFDQGKQLVDTGKLDPRRLAADIAAAPRPLKPEESTALLYDRMRLHNEHAQVMDALDQATQSGDHEAAASLEQRRSAIEDAINSNDAASRRGGYEQGLGLAARKMMIRQDYSLPNLIQRARVAAGGKEIPLDVRTRLEAISKQLDGALNASDATDEIHSQKAADAAIRHISLENRSLRRAGTRQALAQEFANLSQQFRRAAATPRMGLDPELVTILGHMARNRVQAGITSAADVVDHIYAAVKDHIDGITPRDIRDAISGYGQTKQPSQEDLAKQLREVKAHMRLTSALEDANSGQRPLKSGFQHEQPSDTVRNMRRQVQEAMRANGIDPEANIDPDTQMRTALDGVKTRLNHQIDDLNKRIATGEKAKPRSPIQYDQEALNLKAERDRLQAIVNAADNEGSLPQARIKAAEAATQHAITDLEARIKNNDLAPRQQTVSPWSPKLSELKQRHAALRDELNALRDATKPPADPDAIRLAALKTRLNNRAAELQQRLATGNFDPKPKPAPLPLDTEATKLQAHVEALKRQADETIMRQKLAARTLPQRAGDFLPKWRRAVLLSNLPTTLKLVSAGLERIGLTPVEDALGALWSHVPGIASIADKAPVEGGGFNVHAQSEALAQLFNPEMWKSVAQAARTGNGQLDLLYGKPHPPSAGGLEGALDFFGNMHAALKTPTKTVGFVRAFRRIADYEMARGADGTDPRNQAQWGARAYAEANRSIFLNDNIITDLYRNGLGYLRGKGANNTARALEFLLPIVRVPTNYAAEGLSYTAGGVKAATRIVRQVLGEGLRNMKPEDADYVMRNLRKQTVGAALMTIGYMNADKIGGYYSEGEKRDPKDVKPGGVRVMGVDVPRFVLHTPAMEALHVGATLKRVMDAYADQGKSGGLTAGLVKSGAGIAREVPFMDTAMEVGDAVRQPENKGRAFVGGLARDTVVPPDVQRLARVQDQTPAPTTGQAAAQQLGFSSPHPTKRYPQSVGDEIKMGIPGLREQVPTAHGNVSRFGMNPWGDPDNTPPSKLDAELKRLNKPLDFPEQKIYDPTASGNKRVKLSPDEYRAYIQEAGKQAKALLQETFSSPDYQNATLEQQQEMRDHAVGVARHMARMDALTKRHPEWLRGTGIN